VRLRKFHDPIFVGYGAPNLTCSKRIRNELEFTRFAGIPITGNEEGSSRPAVGTHSGVLGRPLRRTKAAQVENTEPTRPRLCQFVRKCNMPLDCNGERNKAIHTKTSELRCEPFHSGNSLLKLLLWFSCPHNHQCSGYENKSICCQIGIDFRSGSWFCGGCWACRGCALCLLVT